MSLSQALNQFAQNLGRYQEADSMNYSPFVNCLREDCFLRR